MPDQKKSTLLTEDENDTVIDLLGYKCQTLATTVIELFTTSGPSSGEWSYKETGVLCLVKDHNKRSYFFRLYCPLRKMLLWEHEVYNDIQYLAPTPFLHTFEAENCIAGFNFASENEGGSLRQVLEETLKAKNQKKVERRNRYNSQVSKPFSEVNGGTNFNVNNFNVNNVVPLHVSKPLGKNGRKKGISKADIGEPHDFRHVSHVGWDPNTGFDCDKVHDPQLKAFFNQAGVSETHLRDKETREFIYDFIVRNGGIEAVKEEMDPPPIPQRIKTAPPRPPTRTLGPPPPPPLRIQPPRTIQIGGGPVKMDEGPVSETVREPAAYPPPPPPPPPPGPPPPPMNLPDLTPSPMVAPNPGAALMQELTSNRKQLKPLNLDKESEDRKLPPQLATDSHFQLMDQIKEGIKLKPVTAPTNQGATVPSGLASALAKALAERSKVIYSDSSSTSDSDEADDEWD